MKNRNVGIIILGIDALLGFVTWAFNQALTDIINTSCSHGPTCPMWKTIELQTNISIGIMVFVAIIGFYLIFFGEDTRIITRIKKVREQIKPKEITKENYSDLLKSFNGDEKIVMEKIIESKGSSFQSQLVSETNFPKAKVSRILDKLEGRGIVERKRRGMANMVVLKH